MIQVLNLQRGDLSGEQLSEGNGNDSGAKPPEKNVLGAKLPEKILNDVEGSSKDVGGARKASGTLHLTPLPAMHSSSSGVSEAPGGDKADTESNNMSCQVDFVDNSHAES